MDTKTTKHNAQNTLNKELAQIKSLKSEIKTDMNSIRQSLTNLKQEMKKTPEQKEEYKLSSKRQVVAIAHMIMDPQNNDPIRLPAIGGNTPCGILKSKLEINLSSNSGAPADFECLAIVTKDPVCAVITNQWTKFPTSTSQIYSGNPVLRSSTGYFGTLNPASNTTGQPWVLGSLPGVTSSSTLFANTSPLYPMMHRNKYYVPLITQSSKLEICNTNNVAVTSNVVFTVNYLNAGTGYEWTGPATITTGSSSVDLNSSLTFAPGSYFSITCDNAGFLTGGMYYIRQTVLTTSAGEASFRPLSDSTITGDSSISSNMTTSASLWLSNQSAEVYQSGSVGLTQRTKGWFNWDNTSFDFTVGAVSTSGNMKLSKGAYTYIKPVDVNDFEFTVIRSENVPSYPSKALTGSVQSVFKTTDVNARNIVLHAWFIRQYETTNMRYSIEPSVIHSSTMESAVDFVGELSQYFENDTHIQGIWKSIKGLASRALGYIVKNPEVVAKALVTAASFL